MQHSVKHVSSKKKMLRNQVELLKTNDENLFGKEFSDYLTESVKSKKSSKEDFLKFLALRFNSNSIIAEDKSKSLRIIEAMKQNKIGVGARKTRNFKKGASDIRVKVSPNHLFLDISPVTANVELVNFHQLIKRLFLSEMLKKQQTFLQLEGQDTFSTKIFKFYKNEQETDCSRGFGIKGVVEEIINKESTTCSRVVFE